VPDPDPPPTAPAAGAPDSPVVPAGSASERRSLFGFVGAYTVSILGDRFGELALPLVVLVATGDPAAAGAVAASIHVPGLVLAPWLGARVDRHPRRRLLIIANLGRAACLAGFAWLAVIGVSEIWAYLLVGVALGAVNVLFGLAGFALLPQIVHGPQLVRANALLEAGDSTSTIVGPAAAGAVITRLSAAFALAVNAASYLISAVLLLVVRPGPPVPAASGGAGPTAAEAAGSRWRRLAAAMRPYLAVLRDPTQRTLQVGLIALSAHGASVVLAIIVLAEQELSLSPFQIGLVLGAAGVGGLAASAVAARWPAPFGSRPGLALMLALSAGFLIVLAAAPAFWWALVATGLVDAAITGAFITVATVRQQRTPAAVLGRVTAASVLCNAGARVVGVAGVGVLLANIGARPTVAISAAVLLLAAGYVAASRAGQDETAGDQPAKATR
jgi:hypothetical protein